MLLTTKDHKQWIVAFLGIGDEAWDVKSISQILLSKFQQVGNYESALWSNETRVAYPGLQALFVKYSN